MADSDKKEDIEFTHKQIDNFMSCITSLKEKGYNVGKTHIQSSYSIVNYNELKFDYVRAGILMYGVNGEINAYQKIKMDIKPLLSLKARITSIKEIEAGDSISYGRTYIASSKQRIATISLGYADGLPRSLSNKDMIVKINNNYRKVLGKICMDQLVIDITDIDDVDVGSVIYIIDSSDS